MAYTTADKLREVLKKVTTTVMSDADVGKFIARADAIINGKVSIRYALPFSATPALVEQLSTDITAYLIMRTLFARDNQNKNDWAEDFNRAMVTLDEIRDGKTLLIDADNKELSLNGHPCSSNTMDYVPTFDEDDIENSVVDDDKIDDIQDAKD